jgi:hypothetical protein
MRSFQPSGLQGHLPKISCKRGCLKKSQKNFSCKRGCFFVIFPVNGDVIDAQPQKYPVNGDTHFVTHPVNGDVSVRARVFHNFNVENLPVNGDV